MFKERKTRRGFTLAEVLIVVAIVAILLAVAIPNVIGYYRSLKLTELDDSARTIFIAAQNRLTAMRNMGADLSALGSGTKSANLSTGGTVEVRTVTEGSADDLASLVPGGSVDSRIHDNHYVVEIDPKTGAVIAVWYWEDESFDYADEAYDEVKPEKKDRLEKAQMVGYYGGTKVDRLEFGQMPFPAVNVVNAEELRVEITVPTMDFGTGSGYQDNSVLVDVLVDGVEVVKDANLWPEAAGTKRVGTVVLDTLNTVTYNDNFNAAAHTTNSGADGWTYGMQYKEWESEYPGSDFPEPGEELTVAVKLHYDGTVNIDGTVTNLMPQTVTVKCNSLFESVDGGTAKIAYGRHLQNLDADTSGVTGITGAKQIRDINFAATVKNTTDTAIYYWGSTYPAQDESYENGQDEFRDFQEINNSLTEYNGQDHEIRNMYIVAETGYGGLFSMVMGGSYHNITIVNPHVHEAPDPDPTTNPGASVGALIGMAYGNVEIRECKVYVDYDPEKDTPELKKQFDQVLAQKLDNMKIDTTPKGNCYVEALLGFPHIEGAEPNSSAGGLVGLFSGNISIQNSFCSIPVVGQLNAGGLVGNASTCNISISKSYSASFVYGHGTVGGLVGHAGDSYSTIKIENCYAAGEIMNGNPSSFIGAGLVNIHENANIEGIVNNYSAVKFVNATGAPKTGSGEEKQGTVYGTYNGDNSSANYYIPDPAVTKGYGNQASGGFVPCGEKVTTADLLEKFKGKPGWTAGAGKAHPYRLLTELDGLPEVYPYPMLTDKPHYGDWLPKATGYSFGYYDNGGGSSYGFWGYIFDPATGRSELIKNGLATGVPGSGNCATDDGYCIPVERIAGATTTTPPAAPTVDGVAATNITVVQTPVGTYTDSTTHKTYDLYKVNGLDGVDKTSFYNKITVGATEYYFNPFFACEVVQKAAGSIAPTDPQEKMVGGSTYPEKTVIIRTARQLYNMAVQTGDEYKTSGNDAQLRKYEQLLDIDYDKYADTSLKGKNSTAPQSPAALSGYGANAGSYDGNGFIIRNLYIGEATNGTGLFGNTQGELSHIRLVNVSVTSSEKNVGALAGRYQGDTIIDCGVYLDLANLPSGISANDAYDTTFMISGEDAQVGGLIGNYNTRDGSQLTDCFAAVKVEGKNYVGGLVGQLSVNNAGCIFNDCYAGGHTETGSYGAEANVSGAKNVGGLIGGATGRHNYTVTLNGVNYSTCSVSMTGTGSDAVGTIGRLVGSKDTGVSITSSGIAYALGSATFPTGGSTNTEIYLTPYAANLADILAVTNGKTAASASKYDGTGSNYPYLSATDAAGAPMTHYGDWPELQEAVFYWEQEGSGTGVATKDAATGKYSGEGYHFYAQGYLNGQQVSLNTLCEAYHELDAAMDGNATSNSTWGYGLYGRTSDQVPTTPSGATTATNNDAETGLKKLLSLDASSVGAGTGASVTMLSGGTADKACSTASKVGTSQTYNLNLGFGAAIEVGTNSTMGQTGNPYQIRNVQQLDNIQNVSSTYKQTHDLYAGTSYTTNYTSASGFVGTYNGQSYRILELSMTNGLFTSINGNATLDSIILYSPSGSATVSGSGATGGLAGSATGSGSAKITNCVVAGYKMNSGNPLGGLVGTVSDRNNLTINFCEAVNTLSGSGVNGGLVGTASANVNINNSYAGGEITRTGFSGGIVGNLSTSASVSYTNVYSYMSMNSVSGSYLYAIGPAGNTWYGGHNNCWYWTGGITGNMYNVQDRDDSGVNAAVTLNQLKNCISGTGIGTVSDEEHTFIPSNVTGLTGPYPYPAVVKDHDGDYVHYGDWKED